MVDRTQLARVNALYGENRDIDAALHDLNSAEGRINRMTIDPSGASIDTSSWDYPAMMVEAVKGNLAARQLEIKQELEALGVTGIEVPEVEPQAARIAQPARQPAPPPARQPAGPGVGRTSVPPRR
jgi:hypothetical protein